MKTLYIDTTNNKRVVAKIIVDSVEFIEISDSATQRPESILNLIEKACDKASISIHDVEHIQVERGPGSYTGLKVGASVASTLSFALGIPIDNLEFGEHVKPQYE